MNNHRQEARDRFFKDSEAHELRIILDNGLYRHLRFRAKTSIVYWFDVITWPGCLCIHGDMGTFTFSCIEDMFQFFRTQPEAEGKPADELGINPGYWAEKLVSIDKSGHTEFDKELFQQRIIEEIRNSGELGRARILREARDKIFIDLEDGEHVAMDALLRFKSSTKYSFSDIWDWGPCHRYTFRFLWCLWAIVYGIRQYDAVKKGEKLN